MVTRQRLGIVAERAGAGLALTATFVGAFAVGIALHLPLPPSRRIATRASSDGIGNGIRGSVEIARFERLSLGGFEARDVVIRDPEGAVVLATPRLRARANMLSMAADALLSSGPIELRIAFVRADVIDVNLIEDKDGKLTLGTTFLAPVKPPPAVPTPPTAPSRQVVVDLPAVEIGSIRVRGEMRAVGPIEADAQGVSGAVYAGPGEVRLDTRPFPVVARKTLPAVLSSTLDFHFRSPKLFWSDFVASFGDILFSGRAKVDSGYVDAWLDVPLTTTDPFRAFVPDLKPGEPVEGHVEWHGALPQLDTTARVQLARATLEARGRLLTIGSGTEFDISSRHVDLSAIRQGLPVTDLGLDAHAKLEVGDGKPVRATVTGTIPATTLEGVEVPESRVECAVAATGVEGTAWLHEPGMPVEAKFKVTRSGEVTVKANTTIESMGAAPRLQGQLDGRAVASLEATWSEGRIDARLTADLERARRGPISMGSGRLTAHAWGEPRDLEVDAEVNGTQLGASGLRWGRVAASLRGPMLKPMATVNLDDQKTPDVRAVATLVLDKGVRLGAASVTILSGGGKVVIKSPLVQPRGEDVDLGKVTVEGLSDEAIPVVARVGAHGFKVQSTAANLRIERVAGLLGLPVEYVRGGAALRIDVEERGSETNGCIAFDAEHAKVFAPEIDASFRAQFNGRHVSVAANASVAGTQPAASSEPETALCMPLRAVRGDAPISLRGGAELDLAGPATSPKSWEAATGTARVSDFSVDLAHSGMNMLLGLAETWAGVKTPPVTGLINAHAGVVRESADAPPAWVLAASTTGFSIDLGTKDAPRRIQGADAFVNASMSPGGRLTTNSCVRDDLPESDMAPCDPHDPNVLVTLDSASDLDFGALLHGSDRWRMLLATARTDATLAIPEHSLATLTKPIPWASELPIDASKARASLRMQGSFAQPRFDYVVQLLEVTPKDPEYRLAETVCALGSYNGARASLSTEILHRLTELPKGLTVEQMCREPSLRSAGNTGEAVFRPVGNINANVDVDWSLALRSSSIRQIPWVADIVASLHDIELSDVPVLMDNDVEGTLAISGGIRNLGLDPEFGVQVDVDGLRVGPTARYDKGQVLLRTDDRGMKGTLKLMSRDPRRGMVTRMTLGLDTRQVQWTEGLTPRFSSDESVDTWVEADAFDVAVLAPLVSPTLSYVEGRLDGSAYATWSPKAGASAVHMADLRLTDGAFEVPLLGQEFTGATARIRATRRDQLAIDGAVARTATGAIAANARIDLTNLAPSHISIGAASDRKNRLRVTYEGIPLGDFDGEIYANIYFGADRNQALLEFDKAHLELSESEVRNVQQTAANPDITIVPSEGASGGRIVASRAGDTWRAWVKAPEKSAHAVPWYVRFITRSPVEVTRSDLDLLVSSPDDTSQAPLLIYPDEFGQARMDGHIDLVDGKLNVVGKSFEIERGMGRLIFDGDPGAPSVNLTTRWDAPDGTRVVADVTGPLKDPTVRFRSVPARPASEILSMILTGTTGTETTTPQPSSTHGSDTAAAAGVGGGVATVGINRLLQDVSPIAVSTRVDTSESQNVRPTIAVQVARNVTAETTVNTGALAPGQTQDVYMLTLDWRFLREWSMRTTVGNKGSSVFDVVWQHRY